MLLKRYPRLQPYPSASARRKAPSVGPLIKLGSMRSAVSPCASSLRLASSASHEEEDDPRSLDWRPKLSLSQDLICMGAAAVTCAAAYMATAPASLSVGYALGIGLLFACLLLAQRAVLMQAMYAARELPVQSLAGPGSSFLEAEEVLVHYRSSQASGSGESGGGGPMTAAPEAAPVALHCFHGFGANCFSFDDAVGPLVSRLPAGSVVSAHDTPGFGLTSRPRAAEKYTLAFNGGLGRLVQDYVIQEGGSGSWAAKAPWRKGNTGTPAAPSEPAAATASTIPEGEGSVAGSVDYEADGSESSSAASSTCSSGDGSSPASSSRVVGRPEPPTPRRRVLLGHSLGSVSAAMQALEGRQDVEALVLVAPAILTWPSRGKQDAAATVQLQQLPGSSGRSSDTGVSTYAPAWLPQDGAAAGEVGKVSAPSNAVGASPGPADGSPTGGGTLLARRLLLTLRAALLLLVLGVLRLLRPLTITLLRALVRSRAFWERGLGAAFYDASKLTEKVRAFGLTEKVLNAYRLPQLVSGWEVGLCRFLEARLAFVSVQDLWRPWLQPAEAGSTGDLVQSLAASIRRRYKDSQLPGHDSAAVSAGPFLPLRVLIIHGRDDRLVPVSNSERLAKSLPPGCGCELVIMERCGHMPHEELPEAFAKVVSRFLDQG